jgi:hypothetical protein
MGDARKIVGQLLESDDDDVGAEMQRIIGGKPRRVKTRNYSAVKYPNGREIRQYVDGRTEYLMDGERHREDGPAYVGADGTKVWFLNGKRHREDGPAIEDANGAKAWSRYGELHREDGPAIEYPDGSHDWYLNGELMTPEEHARRTQNR